MLRDGERDDRLALWYRSCRLELAAAGLAPRCRAAGYRSISMHIRIGW